MRCRSPGEQKVGNGDAAVPKTVGPGEGGIQPVINVAKEILSRSEPRSGTETPIFARTAAEVADSAALLNEEEPEDDMPDEEAGRIGFRRLSGTPISEVANTAAEVADSAQGLDNPEVRIQLTPARHSQLNKYKVVIHNYPREVYNFRDDDDVGDRPPLFAHECVGMYNAEELEAPNKSPEEDKDGDAPAEEVDPDGIDMNDPTLERFPSNREGIMDTVRKLETGLGEDHAAFEGVPLSPVVGAYRPGMEDITGDPFLSSPIIASPIIPRPSRHLEVPRSPHGSISSNHSSPLSLQAIDEGEEPSGSDEESDAILLSPPRPRPGFRAGKRSSTDEDEGIAMKNNWSSGSSKQGDSDGSSPKKAESPRDVISRALQEESPDIEAASASRPAEPQHSLTTPASSPDRHKTESPQIVIQSVEDNEADGPETGRQEDGEAGPATASDSSNRDAGDVGTSSAIEANAGDSNQVRKRGDTVARSGTPASNHSISIHPNREGGWFKSFFRLLFVDWIGGFIRRLCGGRRQT